MLSLIRINESWWQQYGWLFKFNDHKPHVQYIYELEDLRNISQPQLRLMQNKISTLMEISLVIKLNNAMYDLKRDISKMICANVLNYDTTFSYIAYLSKVLLVTNE